jgi:type I restriction enzyme, R subunit
VDPAFEKSTGKPAQDDTELLSRLIADLNDRFGLNLTDVDRVWFEQQQQHLANDEVIREVAQANDYDNFEMYLQPRIADGLIERHEPNEDFFKAFFN